MIEDIGAAEAGQTMTKEEVDEILINLDANGDGTISFDGTRAS